VRLRKARLFLERGGRLENTKGLSDSRERLSGFSKSALIEEVLDAWNALAESENSLELASIKNSELEAEIARLKGLGGISDTKVEMAKRIQDLEEKIRDLRAAPGLNKKGGSSEREELLLAALLDLERELLSIDVI
tara:strand:- start:651 stop:1058 length:408 start_codon:yes stop_codon:yes gene_type:complete